MPERYDINGNPIGFFSVEDKGTRYVDPTVIQPAVVSANRNYWEAQKWARENVRDPRERVAKRISPVVMGLAGGPAGAIAAMSGEAVNAGVNVISGGAKNTWGDLFADPNRHPGWNSFWQLTNPGYLMAGPLEAGLKPYTTDAGVAMLRGDEKRYFRDALRSWRRSIRNAEVPHGPIEQKVLFRAKAFKGGDITDPYFSFFTTDPKYAEQYGNVKPYLIETRNPAIAIEPMIGSSDPVANDMFIWANTRNSPGAKAILGHDMITADKPYHSRGMEILSLSPKEYSLIDTPSTYSLENHNRGSRVRLVGEPKRVQVGRLISRANEGLDAPLPASLRDYWGDNVAIPEDFAASMRLDEFWRAYPNGVDVWYRGLNPLEWYRGGRNWREMPSQYYPAIFGGDKNVANAYVGDAISPNGDPGLLKLITPKGLIRDAGDVGGSHFMDLSFDGKKKVIELNNELNRLAAKWRSATNIDEQFELLQQIEKTKDEMRKNWGIGIDGLSGRFQTTDEIADALKKQSNTVSGILLRNIDDVGRGDEIIWNVSNGGHPKAIHPEQTFEYDLAKRTYLANGGLLNRLNKHYNGDRSKIIQAMQYARGGFKRDAATDAGDQYYDIVRQRRNSAFNALLRAGMSPDDAARLAPMIVTQQTMEGGWVLNRKDNNYGGMKSAGKTIAFDSEDDFQDAYIKMLDSKWHNGRAVENSWRSARNLDDWARILNREDLGLATKEAWEKYNRGKQGNDFVYLYAPQWENNNKSYREHLKKTEDRAAAYLKMVDADEPYSSLVPKQEVPQTSPTPQQPSRPLGLFRSLIPTSVQQKMPATQSAPVQQQAPLLRSLIPTSVQKKMNNKVDGGLIERYGVDKVRAAMQKVKR